MLYEGKPDGTNLKIAIVVSRFNETITSKLLSAAENTLKDHAVNTIDIAWVPGAVEIPLIAQKFAQTKNYDAIITLGCVIRGDTTHYDYVCSMVADGVRQVSLKYDMPVIFGVLTTENVDQALERAGGKLIDKGAGTKTENKGTDAAICALEMVNLIKQLAMASLYPR